MQIKSEIVLMYNRVIHSFYQFNRICDIINYKTIKFTLIKVIVSIIMCFVFYLFVNSEWIKYTKWMNEWMQKEWKKMKEKCNHYLYFRYLFSFYLFFWIMWKCMRQRMGWREEEEVHDFVCIVHVAVIICNGMVKLQWRWRWQWGLCHTTEVRGVAGS